MLTATIEQNGKKRTEHMIVIDAHSHLGQDVDGATMMNPLAPGTGTFDFWGNVQGRIKSDWETHGEKSFMTRMNGIPTKITWSFNPFPFTDKFYSVLEKLGKRYSDLKEKAKFYSFIDQGVVFPFQDVFRDKYPEALYRASNINVSRFTTRFPYSLKLIGYARCDPMEGEKAVNEVRHAREVLGLRGLKLHPRSERWIDDIKSGMPLNVLVEAAKHSMPVIFDTRGRGSILDISELVKSTRNFLSQKHPKLLPHLKVIIAHFAQGNIGDYEVYNAIVQPNTYGDLSMLHGEGAGNFFEDFRSWFKNNNKFSVDKRDWSEYIFYASDYPYFGDIHAHKLMKYIINKRFFDSGGTLKDTRNILGMNQLKVLPEYNLPLVQPQTNNKASTIISQASSEVSSYEIGLRVLAKLIVENKIDIKKFCVRYDDAWDNFNNIALDIINATTKKEMLMSLVELVRDKILLIAPLSDQIDWNSTSLKYFDPKNRAFLAGAFKQAYLAITEEQAMNSMVQILS